GRVLRRRGRHPGARRRPPGLAVRERRPRPPRARPRGPRPRALPGLLRRRAGDGRRRARHRRRQGPAPGRPGRHPGTGDRPRLRGHREDRVHRHPLPHRHRQGHAMGVTTGTRSIDWHDGAVVAVDQRALPGEYRLMRLTTVDEVIGAIRTLAVRGAPAIGAAGAFAVALAALATPDERQVRAEAERIAAARPTAVNLRWAVDRVLRRLPEGADAVLDEALALLTEDEETTRAAASRAAGYVLAVCERRPLR